MMENLWLDHIKPRLMLLVFLWAGLIACVISAVQMIWCIVFTPDTLRPMRIAVAYDQLANAALGGDEDETISSRAGREREQGERWACVLCRLLDWMDTNHCARAWLRQQHTHARRSKP